MNINDEIRKLSEEEQKRFGKELTDVLYDK